MDARIIPVEKWDDRRQTAETVYSSSAAAYHVGVYMG